MINTGYRNGKYDLLIETVLTTLIVGFLIHGFCYSNLNLSHDSLYEMTGIDINVLMTRGRFVIPLIMKFNSLLLPWFNGLISLSVFGVAYYFLFDALIIKNRIVRLFVIGCLLTDRSFVMLTSTYLQDVIYYAIACLLASVSVWIMIKKTSWRLLASVLIVLSLGVYQSYIQMIVILMSASYLSDLLNKSDRISVITRSIKDMATIGSGMIVYFVIYKIIMHFGNYVDPFPDWKNQPSNAVITSLSEIKTRIITCLDFELDYIVHFSGDNSILGCVILFLIVVITSVLFIVICDHFKIATDAFLICILLFLLFPFESGFILFFANLAHDIMYNSFAFISFWAACLVQLYFDSDGLQKRRINHHLIMALAIVSGTLIIINSMFANRVYVKKDLELKSTMALINRMIDRIEQTDGYIVGETPVVVYGNVNYSPLVNTNSAFDYYGCSIGCSFAVTYSETLESYIHDYLNYPMNISIPHENINDTDLADMPIFPSPGSVQNIDGTIFVRLS